MTHEEFRRWLRLPSNGVPEPPGDHGHPELSEEIDGLYDITALLENFARGNTRRITEIEHWIESFRENT
jgi:hypothetical protein